MFKMPKTANTLSAFPRTRTPVRLYETLLASDEVREEVREEPEESQPRNAIGGENPGAAAGKMSIG